MVISLNQSVLYLVAILLCLTFTPLSSRSSELPVRKANCYQKLKQNEKKGTSMQILSFLLPVLCILQFAEAQQCGSQAGNALCANNLCCSQFGFCGTSDAYCVTGCQSGSCRNNFSPPPQPSPLPPPTVHVSPTPSSGFGTLLTRALFEELYPNRNKTFYTYDAFIIAAGVFPQFCNEGGKVKRRRELAAFSAHVQQEVAGLFYVEEIDQSNSYCDTTSTDYPCAPNQKYFGRGPLQLSWNFNYGAASKDPRVGVDILKSPFLVSLDPVLAFKASLWFWMTPSGTIPSIHDVIIGKYKLTGADRKAHRKRGFGYTIDIINGGLECGKVTPQAQNRVKYFTEFCKQLNVSTGPNLECSTFAPF